MDCGAKRGVTVAIEKKLKRRNTVEPVIGHMKADGRLGRNFLKGAQGDALNAPLRYGSHLRKILRRLALLCAQILESFQHFIQKAAANSQQLMTAIR